MDDIFQKYYPDGLVWEVRGTHLTVHWGQTHMIGMVHEIVKLPEEKIAMLLNAWFPRFEEWNVARGER